jgi:hypothetical protein
MQYAADRCRFKRRIRQSEINSEIFLVMNIAIELYIVCINDERTSSQMQNYGRDGILP